MSTNSIVPLRTFPYLLRAGNPISNRRATSSSSQREGDVALVVYSRPYPAASVLQTLIHTGFLTVERPATEDAMHVLNELKPSLIVLAIDPRHERDIQLSRLITSRTNAAVVALSPAGQPDADAALLNVGADVCLHDVEVADLFGPQIAALTRRARMLAPEPPMALGSIAASGLVVDLARREVLLHETQIAVTPTEFKILKFLVGNAGTVCSIPEIFREVHGYDASIVEAREMIKVYIRRIRRKLEVDPSVPDLIVNVRGFGYLLETGAEASGRAQGIAA